MPSFWRLVYREIAADDIFMRASSLAYSTLASLVPIFAIIMAVLSGPAFKDRQERVLDALASTMVPNDKSSWIIDAPDSPEQERFKQVFRENIVVLAERAGAVGAFGFVVLLFTVGLLFRTVERSFNVIWRAASQRSFFMRVAVATSMIFWGPVMLALSVTLTEKLGALPIVGTYVLPVAFTSLAFTMFYMVMPNTRVRPDCALKAGIAAALAWEGVKMVFLFYVTQIVSYNRVYGSLGLIPMLFLWVYVNWIVVLAGTEIAYCLQFRRALREQCLAAERQKRLSGISPGIDLAATPSPTLILALAIELARRFQAPCPGGVKLSTLATALQIERGVARSAAERLADRGILVRAAHKEEEGREGSGGRNSDSAYLPAGDPRVLNLGGILAIGFEETTAAGSGPAWEQARSLLRACASDGARKLSLQDMAGISRAPNETPSTAGAGITTDAGAPDQRAK